MIKAIRTIGGAALIAVLAACGSEQSAMYGEYEHEMTGTVAEITGDGVVLQLPEQNDNLRHQMADVEPTYVKTETLEKLVYEGRDTIEVIRLDEDTIEIKGTGVFNKV